MKESDGKSLMLCGQIETKIHYPWCKDNAFLEKKKRKMRFLQKQLKVIHIYFVRVESINKVLTIEFFSE